MYGQIVTCFILLCMRVYKQIVTCFILLCMRVRGQKVTCFILLFSYLHVDNFFCMSVFILAYCVTFSVYRILQTTITGLLQSSRQRRSIHNAARYRSFHCVKVVSLY